jgi:hypothetical protein
MSRRASSGSCTKTSNAWWKPGFVSASRGSVCTDAASRGERTCTCTRSSDSPGAISSPLPDKTRTVSTPGESCPPIAPPRPRQPRAPPRGRQRAVPGARAGACSPESDARRTGSHQSSSRFISASSAAGSPAAPRALSARAQTRALRGGAGREPLRAAAGRGGKGTLEGRGGDGAHGRLAHVLAVVAGVPNELRARGLPRHAGNGGAAGAAERCGRTIASERSCPLTILDAASTPTSSTLRLTSAPGEAACAGGERRWGRPLQREPCTAGALVGRLQPPRRRAPRGGALRATLPRSAAPLLPVPRGDGPGAPPSRPVSR